MAEPRIDTLGVYRVPVTEELFREQFDTLYGYPMSKQERAVAERQCREQLASIVLLEVAVLDRDARFEVGDFTQPQDGVPEGNWQAAYAEAFLTPDGEALAVKRWGRAPESGDLRIGFFLHFWQSGTALRSTYGDVVCPEPQEMPDRLRRLVPYEPVD